jgi:hypothetical protein
MILSPPLGAAIHLVLPRASWFWTGASVPLFELVIALLLAGAILSAWARRISVP